MLQTRYFKQFSKCFKLIHPSKIGCWLFEHQCFETELPFFPFKFEQVRERKRVQATLYTCAKLLKFNDKPLRESYFERLFNQIMDNDFYLGIKPKIKIPKTFIYFEKCYHLNFVWFDRNFNYAITSKQYY